MLERKCLIIIQTAQGLRATICHVGLRTCEMVYTQAFDCLCDTQENILAALQEIQAKLQSVDIIAPTDVRLCLIPDQALFREWSFPFRSKTKIKQALGLLLDTEFPFADTLEHRTYYSQGFSTGKNTQVITVSCSKTYIQTWVDACTELEWYPSLITFDPFPLLYGLPKSAQELSDIQLILHVQAQHSTISLVDHGTVRRVRYIAGGIAASTASVDEIAEQSSMQGNVAKQSPAMKALLRDIAVVLDGIAIKPTQLILFGDCFLQPATAAALGKALNLPVAVLGQDIPYGNSIIESCEKSMARLAAISLARMPAWVWRLQSRCPSFHRQHHVQSALLTRYKKYIAPLCALSLLALCYLFSVWAEGNALHTQARHYETQMRQAFQDAVPGSRKTLSMRQMRSILAGKIQELQGEYDERTAYFTLKALQSIHTAIPESIQIRINRISFERARCQIGGIAGNYEQVESIRQELAKLDTVEDVQILRATAQETDSFAQAGAQETDSTGQGSVAFDLAITFIREN